MNIRTFQGESMAAALKQVKRELGAEAVILHTRTFRRGGVLGFGAKRVVEVTASKLIQEPASLLADGFAKTLQVGNCVDTQIVRQGQRPMVQQGCSEFRLGVFLDGVIEEAGVVDVPVLGEGGFSFPNQDPHLRHELGGGFVFPAVQSPYGVGRTTDDRATVLEGELTGGVLLVEFATDL